MLTNKLITLVGGGGFLGRYAAQALLARGARVRIAERDPRTAYFVRTQGGLGQTQFVAADVTRPDTIVRACAGADGVVNLVGTFTGDLRRIHVDGARAVAQAASATGAALVHVSAIGADPASASVYGATKGEGEAAVRSVDPAAVILRPSTVFGREDQFINRFAQMIARFPVVPVLRAPAKFQPVFVGDVAEAIAAALGGADRHAGKTFELGGPEVLSMIELQRWIAAAIGRSPEFVELPDMVGGVIAGLGFLPGAPITADQWKMLQHDAVAAPGSEGLAALGVTPTPLEAVAPGWLVRYRRAGRFGALEAAQS
jgi:uncharacterized protein YbjT (DUF2867 family)